jgi:hypothetical protein
MMPLVPPNASFSRRRGRNEGHKLGKTSWAAPVGCNASFGPIALHEGCVPLRWMTCQESLWYSFLSNNGLNISRQILGVKSVFRLSDRMI